MVFFSQEKRKQKFIFDYRGGLTYQTVPSCTVPRPIFVSRYGLVRENGTGWYKWKCSYLYQPVPTCINLYHNIFGTVWYKQVQVGTDWYRLIQIESPICTNLYQPVSICTTIQLVQVGTDWYRLVQIETGWYRLVQIGKDLKYFGGMIQIYILLSHTSLL